MSAAQNQVVEANSGEIQPPTLDISKLHALHSDQQDLFLLSYVAELRQYTQKLSAQQLPAQQPAIKKEVIKIIGLTAPLPSRVIRHSLGRILADTYTRGSRQLLVETINECLAFVNAGKTEKEVGPRYTATTCLGYVFKCAGDSAISLHGLVVASLIKLLKLAQSHTGFRASIFRALGQCVDGLGSSIDETVARDIWKQTRTSLSSDKSPLVQKFCCLCISSLFKFTSYFSNTNDLENAKSSTWKLLEANVATTRNAACKTLAEILLKFFSDTKSPEHIPTIRKPKKSTKKQTIGSEDEADLQKPEPVASAKSAVQLTLSLPEILRTISSQFVKPSTTNKARCSLGICYKTILEGLPEKLVHDKYGELADHFFNDILGHASIWSNRTRLLLTRKLTDMLLNDIVGSKLLSENGQVHACRWLINDVLKNYPKILQGRREPSKHALAATLRVLTHLLRQLGSATTILQDSCREALLHVAKHPSYTVQTHVAACLSAFVTACPAQLAKSLDQALTQLKKELELIDGKLAKRATVYALSIAGMLRAAREHPLYGSLEAFSNILTYATDLLKVSATSELRLCATQVQIAWTLLGGLMSLGPNFIKVHLNQLLLLWRNALPAPLTSDNTARRSQLELSFLTHVRETALAALSAFLDHNSNLVTSDGSRRIAVMLQNSIAFVESLPSARQTEDLANRLFASLQLHDHAVSLRKRILSSTIKMLSLKHIDRNEVISLSDTVGMAIRLFSDPAQPIQRNLEASLASSASSFENIWDLTDNWAYGVNSLISRFEILFPANGHITRVGIHDPVQETLEALIGDAASSPLLPALEHDATSIYCGLTDSGALNSYSPETSCATLAIQLFALALPLQPPRIQESCLEQVATVLAQPMQREPGRKFALQVNCVTAILGALVVANGETNFLSGKLAAETLSKSLAEIIRKNVLDQDAVLRVISTQALGRLCYLAGNQFTNTEVKNLIDVIVANRDPHVRAGCALALGTIHSQVGAMAASYHLKNIIGVLLTLCNDKHPIVHFWSLNGLAEVADSAGLSFSAHASSTLGMLAQLYSSDDHSDESPASATSTVEMEYETPTVIGKCVDSVINVLGPDLQDVAKARNLILNLIQHFSEEQILGVRMQSYICLGHVSLYAPAHVQLASYVHQLQAALASGELLLEEIAISGLENLMKRNASEVLIVAHTGLGDELWDRLDHNPQSHILRKIIRTWMQQTCLDDTLNWIEQCQNVLSKARKKPVVELASENPKTALPDLADEDVAGLTAAAAVAEGEKAESATDSQEHMRWQSRDFAMSLLSEMLDIVRSAMLADTVIAAEQTLLSRVADIVRIAFLASTAVVVELRIRGLHIFDQILKLFGRTPDPDFFEASLLEQYQAQISSALTPAFASDSNAELAANAIAVCATFVATGIVTNVDRMGRIFKVLSTGLENLVIEQPQSSFGDIQDLTWNAQSMLKMSLLTGWAQLQLASTEQAYLEEIIQPYVPKLAPLWLNSLQEFAGLRFEPEISDSLGDYASSNLQERYASFDREVRLTFYQKSWLSVVDAIALLVEKDSNAVFDALDNKKISEKEAHTNGDNVAGKDMNFREEPVAFFFILFGLAFEALVTQARDNQAHALAILSALRRMLTPAVSGNAIYQDAVFDELTDTLDRLALTSSTEIQVVLVQIARTLSLDHVVAKSEDRQDKLSEDVDQLFELTRIIILVLAGMIPTLEEAPSRQPRPLTEEHVSLVHLCFQALTDVAEIFPSIIQADLLACITHSYCAMLATGICQQEVIPRLMPNFRTFLQQVVKKGSNHSDQMVTRLVLGTLRQMLSILEVAQRRESDSSIICAKNTLLSITILLTTASPAIPTTDRLVVKALNELFQTLQDVGLAKIAAGCIRSLLLSPSKSACEDQIARNLWPRLIIYIMDSEAEDPESVKTSLMQALVLCVTALAGQAGRVAAVSILIPCLLTRATFTVPNGSKEDLAKESASRLLELAGTDGAAFRAAVAQLEDANRSRLETLLRSAGLGRKQSTHRRTDTGISLPDEDDSKPAIALRFDF